MSWGTYTCTCGHEFDVRDTAFPDDSLVESELGDVSRGVTRPKPSKVKLKCPACGSTYTLDLTSSTPRLASD